MAAAVGIGRFAYTPLLPPMRDALGWTLSQAGDVASANFAGYAAGALAASALAQRADRRRWLAAGMLASGATTAAGAVLVSFAAWTAIRLLSGIASAFCLVLGTAVVTDVLARHSRPGLGALHFSGVGAGIVASVLLMELARHAGASMFGQWGALGIASSALLAASWLILRTVPDRPAPARPASRAPGASPSPPGALGRLIAAYGLFGFGYVVTATFIVAMARRLDHAAIVEPVTWIVVGLLAAPSVVAWQGLAGRLGMFPALRLAYLLEAAGVLLAGFGSARVAVVVGGALLGGTFMGITALGLSAARQTAGRDHGRAIGWMTASFGLGQLLGPAVAGRLAQMTEGFEAPSVVAALLLLVGAVLLRRGSGA